MRMAGPRWLPLLLVLTSGLSARVAGQIKDQPCPSRGTALDPSRSWALARRYAPILRFAPGEHYFPTIPYFSAWDGRDNTADTLRDLADLTEIAPHDARDSVSWDRLNAMYERRLFPTDTVVADTLKRFQRAIERSAVFYRVRDLCGAEVRELRRFLRSDEQAWSRFDHRVLDSLGGKLRFRVVEYYFYYVRDAGLEGHPQDIEFVYLFLPYHHDDPLSDVGSRYRIVVGGGHSDRTPNNILVLTGDRAVNHAGLNVLVELGGHSSAPDQAPYGQFAPGLDVNWHVYDIWGTRDIQAVAGVGFDGPYQTGMTFPRDTADAVTLYPATLDPRLADSLRQMRVQQTVGGEPVKVSSKTGCGSGKTTGQLQLTCPYLLLPVVVFEDLSRALEDTTPAAVPGVVQRIEEIRALLRDWNFTGFQQVVDTAAAVRRMRDWNKDPWWDERHHYYALSLAAHGKQSVVQAKDVWPVLERRRHRIWDHEQYAGSPTQILKKHLYRPTWTEIQESPWNVFDLLTYGLSDQPPRASQFHVGLVVPAFRLPTRFPGFLEFQFGRYGRELFHGEHRISWAAVWTTHYNARLSWYFKGEYVKHRREILHDPAVRDLNLSAGVSVLASLGRKAGWLGNLANTIRLRTGLVLNPQSDDELFGRTGWEIQLSFRQ